MLAHDDNTTNPPAHIAQPLGWLRLLLLIVWAAVSFGTCYFARDLSFGIAGQTLAYGLAGQAILIVFIVLVLVNAVVFNRQAKSEESASDEARRGV